MARTGQTQPVIEIADILRRHGEAFRLAHAGHLGRAEQRVISAIMACRTAALGGHVEACDDCGTTRVACNSCRNRHCPKCQGAARAKWLADRQSELLPVPCFHVVFTLPAPVAAIAFQNKAVVHAILFKAAVEAMTTMAANPRRLGAKIGGIAVLHTWGQALTHHPTANAQHLSGHVHCVVPGGGLSPDGTSWIAGRANFFPAVKPLAMLFRRLFLERLKTACKTGTLGFFGDLAHLADPAAFASHIAAMRRIPRVVCAKKPFGGPAQVLACPGRHTHRVAISNSRPVACDDSEVAFSWKDYRHDGVKKIMRLKPDEFIRRLSPHTLPGGFHRIRHFGFMANGHRAARIALCRSLLPEQPGVPESVNAKAPPADKDTMAGTQPPPCPACGGTMRIFERLPRECARSSHCTSPFWCDTS